MNKNVLFCAIVSVSTLIVTEESFSLLYTFYVRSRIQHVNVDSTKLKPDDQSYRTLQSFFHPEKNGNPFFYYDQELGWKSGPNVVFRGTNTKNEPWAYKTDPKTARQDLINTGNAVIGAFGDSFTLGAEVNDNQAWNYFFEMFSGVDVDNFGVGGYGTFQSVLRMEREIKRHNYKILVLGIYSENINRVFNTFQPFYLGHPLGFKPYVHVKDGVAFARPPVINLSQYDNASGRRPDNYATIFQDINRAIDAAAVEDLHVNFTVPIQFPFALSAYDAFLVGRIGNHLEKADYLWRTKNGQIAMRYVLSRFVRTAKATGAFPVVMIFPDVFQSTRLTRNPSYVAGYQRFLAEIKKEGEFESLVIVDGLTLDIDQKRFHVAGLKVECHASRYANKEMAYRLAAELRNAGQLNFVNTELYEKNDDRTP